MAPKRLKSNESPKVTLDHFFGKAGSVKVKSEVEPRPTPGSKTTNRTKSTPSDADIIVIEDSDDEPVVTPKPVKRQRLSSNGTHPTSTIRPAPIASSSSFGAPKLLRRTTQSAEAAFSRDAPPNTLNLSSPPPAVHSANQPSIDTLDMSDIEWEMGDDEIVIEDDEKADTSMVSAVRVKLELDNDFDILEDGCSECGRLPVRSMLLPQPRITVTHLL